MPGGAPDLTRYELFGWDYAAINPLSKEETGWCLHWAEQVGGPILGLACGGARLLIRLAEAGYDVTGIDLSETMLGIGRVHVEQKPTAVQRRIHLLRQDMASFDLGKQFALVMIADNSFRELPTRRQLCICLRAIRRHLQPGGRLLIVERRLRPEMYPNGVRSLNWSDPRCSPDGGESVRRRGHIRLHKNRQRVSGVFEYEVTDAEGNVRIVRCPWSAPILTLDEYLSLFRQAGFQTEVFSDYGFVSNDQAANLWCFACSHL